MVAIFRTEMESRKTSKKFPAEVSKKGRIFCLGGGSEKPIEELIRDFNVYDNDRITIATIY